MKGSFNPLRAVNLVEKARYNKTKEEKEGHVGISLKLGTYDEDDDSLKVLTGREEDNDTNTAVAEKVYERRRIKEESSRIRDFVKKQQTETFSLGR